MIINNNLQQDVLPVNKNLNNPQKILQFALTDKNVNYLLNFLSTLESTN